MVASASRRDEWPGPWPSSVPGPASVRCLSWRDKAGRRVGRPADRQSVANLLNRLLPARQQLDLGASLWIAQRVKWIGFLSGTRHPTERNSSVTVTQWLPTAVLTGSIQQKTACEEVLGAS